VSIVAYTGLPGSGKSYSVVEQQILPGLRAGREVVTNIPMNQDVLGQLGLPGKLTQFDIAELEAEPSRVMDYCRAGCIFIIDEVWKLWPQGMNGTEVPDVYKKLIAEHRHMVDAQGNSTQIVLVVQDLANIAAFGRRLVEYTYCTTKLSFVGLARAYRVDVFHGCVTGCTPNPKKAIRQLTGRYRKEIYSLYKSHTMSEAGAQGANETKMDGRANIFRRPVFIVGLVVCPILIIYSLHAFSQNFHGFAMKSKAPAIGGAPGAGADAQRSGAAAPHREAPSQATVAVVSGPSIRVLFAVFGDSDEGNVRAFLAVGSRVEEVEGRGECRIANRRAQCLWRDVWYDEQGEIEDQVHAPLGAWSAGRGSRGPG